MDKMTPKEAWDFAAELIKTHFPDPNGQELLMRIHTKNRDKMLLYPAAVKHHHNYEGGYIVHVNEVMMGMDSMLNSGFGPDDINWQRCMLAAYVHDFDKLERYEVLPFEPPTDKQISFAMKLGVNISKDDSKGSISVKINNAKENVNDEIPDPNEKVFIYKDNNGHGFDETAKVQQMLVAYRLPLPDEVLHAVSMHHGGYAPLAKDYHMNMSPMATLLNMADMASSKIWALT